MAFTPFANELFLEWLLTTNSVTRPASLYLAWHSGDPGDDGSTNEQVVGTDPDYVRQALAFGAAEWISSLKSAISRNSSTVTITPAVGVSYNIYGFSIWDAATGGNCIAATPTTTAIPVSNASPISLIAGKIPVILSSSLPGITLTSYGAKLVLDWLLAAGVVIVQKPVSLYIGLHSADPGDDGSANEITVDDDPDYARQLTGFPVAVTLTGSNTYTKNNVDSIWTPGAGADFTVPYISIWDALSLGNSLAIVTCSPEKIGVEAQTLSVSANEVTILARV